MDSVESAILNALKVNMGHREGERVAIVQQFWSPALGEEHRLALEESRELCERMFEVYSGQGIDTRLFSYGPTEARNGADAPPGLYRAFDDALLHPVVFMPTAFSLTHTPFRKSLTDRGSRVASMPTFTLDMFRPGGPMDADYNDLARRTKEIADALRESDYVRVRAEGTDIVVNVDRNLVHESSGLIRDAGSVGNLPGAEAFAVPVHGGDSRGYITVPAGWGGAVPLRYAARLTVRDGRFTDVQALDGSGEAQAYLDETVRPTLFGDTGYEILAELGIGTNPNITPATVARDGWKILTAEKIGGSAHFANGNSKGMGGQNDVRVHVDWVVPDVIIDYSFRP